MTLYARDLHERALVTSLVNKNARKRESPSADNVSGIENMESGTDRADKH